MIVNKPKVKIWFLKICFLIVVITVLFLAGNLAYGKERASSSRHITLKFKSKCFTTSSKSPLLCSPLPLHPPPLAFFNPPRLPLLIILVPSSLFFLILYLRSPHSSSAIPLFPSTTSSSPDPNSSPLLLHLPCLSSYLLISNFTSHHSPPHSSPFSPNFSTTYSPPSLLLLPFISISSPLLPPPLTFLIFFFPHLPPHSSPLSLSLFLLDIPPSPCPPSCPPRPPCPRPSSSPPPAHR